MTKAQETDTCYFSASRGAHIHKEQQKINVKLSTYLVTQMAAETPTSGWLAFWWIEVRK